MTQPEANTTVYTKVLIRIPTEWVTRMKEQAEAEYCSMNTQFLRAVRCWLERPYTPPTAPLQRGDAPVTEG